MTKLPDPPAAQPADLPAAAIARLLERLLAGERSAIARAATLIESGAEHARPLLAAIGAHTGQAVVLGFAGPPGAGKSTLVNALIREACRRGVRVAVIAVDPSSPLSGGSILGDRVRMTAAGEDEAVFVRSLSAAGHLGGLSPAAVSIIDVFDAAGFPLVVLETVGTGQSEVDIAEIADVRIVLSAPGLGDGIQAMKSGLLEIADILVVNKADRPEAEHTRQQLISACAMRPRHLQPHAILATIATSGEGIGRLLDAALEVAQARCEPVQQRRRRRARYLIAREAAALVAARIRAGGADATSTDAITDRLLAGEISAADAARAVLDAR